MSARSIVHIGTSDVAVGSRAGGALQRRIAEAAAVQARDGHAVTIVSPGPRLCDRIDAGVEYVQVDLRTTRPVRDYEFLVKARSLIRGRRFDVLHAHGSPDAARILGSRADRSVQSVDYFRYRLTGSRPGHRYYESSLARHDQILAVSQFCAAQLADFYPSLGEKIAVVPNGVNLEQFSPQEDGIDARAALGLPTGPLVVYLGRVCEQKGSTQLAGLSRALARSTAFGSGDGAVRVIAAGPSERFGSRTEAPLITRLRMSGVICTGPIDEDLVAPLLRQAAVVVLPTWRDEMFGMAALEALACGTPVVASRLGGIPEAVGEAAILVTPRNDHDLLSGVTAILGNPQLASEMSARATRHARRFGWPEIARLTYIAYGLD